MAKTVSNNSQELALKFLNTAEQQQLFSELIDSVQIKILNFAFRKAGKIILDNSKSNFDGVKKNKSKTGYADLDKSFKMKQMHTEIGMIIGMQAKEGYKYRFLNYGTKKRSYKLKSKFFGGDGKAGFYKTSSTEHFTGTIQPNRFFTDAVESNADNVLNTLSNEIVNKFESVVKKYEKSTK